MNEFLGALLVTVGMVALSVFISGRARPRVFHVWRSMRNLVAAFSFGSTRMSSMRRAISRQSLSVK